MKLVDIAARLRDQMRQLRFSAPAAYVYFPLDYAWEPHRLYLEKWGGRGAETLLVGMNPGPYGMAQTGVPFGAVGPVRDWLGCAAPVAAPANTHPKRPVEGFACRREEVSGQRLWGWARDAFGTPEAFFARFFVSNYCPLLFLAESAANVVPEKLKSAELAQILGPCDAALRDAALALGVKRVVGIGAFAEARAREALADTAIAVGRILHPSPANPAANHGWGLAAAAQLREMGVELP